MNLTDYHVLVQRWADKEKDAVATKTRDYAVDNGDVLALIKQTALMSGVHPLKVWEAWALRHVIPLVKTVLVEDDFTTEGGAISSDAARLIRARLADLFGYVCLGLALVEEGIPDRVSEQHPEER